MSLTERPFDFSQPPGECEFFFRTEFFIRKLYADFYTSQMPYGLLNMERE